MMRVTFWAVYMSPEYQRGELSPKADAYAFGLVVIETLTGYAVVEDGRADLVSMFEQDLDTADKLSAHLDRRASWHQHQDRVATIHGIADQCLEPRRHKRASVEDIIRGLEEVRRGAEALPVTTEGRECLVCLREEAEVSGFVMLRPCGHACVCRDCGAELQDCPKCRQAVQEFLPVFF
jgi:hypothetical protein